MSLYLEYFLRNAQKSKTPKKSSMPNTEQIMIRSGVVVSKSLGGNDRLKIATKTLSWIESIPVYGFETFFSVPDNFKFVGGCRPEDQYPFNNLLK